MTYNVFSGTLNPTQSINQSICVVRNYLDNEQVPDNRTAVRVELR